MTRTRRAAFTLFSVVAAGVLHAQSCQLALPASGKMTLSIRTFTGPMFSDPKFMKAKDEKKDEQVNAFNAGVLGGTVPTASNSEMEFSLNKAVVEAGDEYTIGYNVGGTDYFSYVVCKDDTLYIARNRGVVMIGPADNPIGFTIQGIQKVPVHLKVGDVLEPFTDASFMFPTTADVTLKKKVFSHMRTTSSREFGFATDSRTGESGFGPYNKTTTSAVYKTIDVAARKEISFSAHSIQGMNAVVSGTEEVTVGGVAYTAYIIESESWTRSSVTTDYESADEAVSQEAEAFAAKIQTKQERLMTRKGFTNKLGYMVMYSKVWFVPALGGAVITEAYDTTGAITTIMRLVKVE
ncbi:MAG: hypothetical protein IPG92_03455 [Flavobacteriales bacterium]|nr:hypothetical protein [Flavobacteriales bacterium]